MSTPGASIPEAPSSLALFLESLLTEGRALVSPGTGTGNEDDQLRLLAELDARARLDLAGEGPALSAEAALWAARILYDVCRFIVCRDAGEELVRNALTVPCPQPRGPATDWSADLTLRHLPALFGLARHLSNADPLVEEMQRLAVAWPLSSVGIPGLSGLNLDSFLHYPALARLYADRIAAASDTTRLGEPRLDNLLRADFGAYPELAPALAAKLSGDARHAAEAQTLS